MNVAIQEKKAGCVYGNRSARAYAVNDLDRCMANLELALPHFVEAARIFRAINHVDEADKALRDIDRVEKHIRQIGIARQLQQRGAK